MATYDYGGYDDDQITFPGGTANVGETVTFTQAADHVISITDNDTSLQDGTDDRDDEDSSQTAIVYDELGNVETSGQVQPRERIQLSDGTNTYVMHRVYIAATNSYYYIFEDPPPEMNVTYTVTSVTTPNSTSYSSFSTTGVTCFARGTRIATPEGECPVEWLRTGDLVDTLDHGPQTIRWIGRRMLDACDLRSNPKLRPIRLTAGLFGPGRPSRDLSLSRQHRVLLTHFESRVEETLGPAIGIARAGLAEIVSPPIGVEYFHLLLDRHEVLFANGLPAESLYLGPQARDMIGAEAVSEVEMLFRDLPDVETGRPARKLLTARATQDLLENGATPAARKFAG